MSKGIISSFQNYDQVSRDLHNVLLYPINFSFTDISFCYIVGGERRIINACGFIIGLSYSLCIRILNHVMGMRLGSHTFH